MKRERKSVNPTREELIKYIGSNPGISFNMIKTAFRLNDGTLRYHLEYLEGEKMIIMIKRGHNRCYFTDYYSSIQSSGSNGRELSSVERRVFSIVEGRPGIARKEILQSMEIRRTDLYRTIRSLKEKRMIWELTDGRVTRYEPITKEKLKGEVIAILIEKLLDEEIDMETFRAIKDRIGP